MKGKKIDNLFVNNFLSECILNNQTSIEDIVSVAQKQIHEIDEKLKESNNLKILRSKLLDVIYTFQKPNKKQNNFEHILPLFKIHNPNVCKILLHQIKNDGCIISHYLNNLDFVFALKQLVEYKVLSKKEDSFVPGEFFDDYLFFVLKEV